MIDLHVHVFVASMIFQFHFQISPDCRYMLTTVMFEIGDEQFSCCGKRLLVEGFTGVTSWQAITQDETMPSFKIDDFCSLQDVSCIAVACSPEDG